MTVVSCPSELTFTFVAGAPPTVTADAPENPVPLTVIVVPPAFQPHWLCRSEPGELESGCGFMTEPGRYLASVAALISRHGSRRPG